MSALEKTILGRTGIEVTVAGLGGGGFSRLGVDISDAHAAEIVRAAFDSGVNFFDTAMAYGTESAIALGLQGISRDKYVLSTKFTYAGFDGKVLSPQAMTFALDESLKRLDTDYIDVYHLHGVTADKYESVRDAFVPVLERAKQQGKIRAIGITEKFAADTQHVMLPMALKDDLFDVMMVGYNMLNPSAAKEIFPQTIAKNIGVLCMFAVRQTLHSLSTLRAAVEKAIDAGYGSPELIKSKGILSFLDLPTDAYRFCRHAPGVHVTLTGTKSKEHLMQNLDALCQPALSDETLDLLDKLFGDLSCISGQ